MGGTTPNIIRIQTREASLKRKLRRHLYALGFKRSDEGLLQADGANKAVIRTLHAPQRSDRLKANDSFIKTNVSKLLGHFASGHEVDPARISPKLEKISSDTWQSDLFRLAALTWSVPVSNGFGRRMRYLVWDENNGKLMGLLAIGDPVFNLRARDQLIGWSSKERGARLVNIMDAYVLGSLPPYNTLLAGKLIACLLRTRDIYDDFSRTYGNTTGIISNEEKKARLLAVTTSSSMGRSSVYNRLKLDDIEYLTSIGYTGGWGHFHIPDKLFDELRDYLRQIGHHYADYHRFGQGPNWKLRTTRAALVALGFKDDILRHGIQREVFICPLASNAAKILASGKGRPNLQTLLSVKEVSGLAIDRWLVPRAARRPDYSQWRADDVVQLLGTQQRLLSQRDALAG